MPALLAALAESTPAPNLLGASEAGARRAAGGRYLLGMAGPLPSDEEGGAPTAAAPAVVLAISYEPPPRSKDGQPLQPSCVKQGSATAYVK